MSSHTSSQSAPEPQREAQIVRLSLQRFANVWSINCEVCHQVLFTGVPSDYNLTVESIVRTAAALHRHCGCTAPPLRLHCTATLESKPHELPRTLEMESLEVDAHQG